MCLLRAHAGMTVSGRNRSRHCSRVSSTPPSCSDAPPRLVRRAGRRRRHRHGSASTAMDSARGASRPHPSSALTCRCRTVPLLCVVAVCVLGAPAGPSVLALDFGEAHSTADRAERIAASSAQRGASQLKADTHRTCDTVMWDSQAMNGSRDASQTSAAQPSEHTWTSSVKQTTRGIDRRRQP